MTTLSSQLNIRANVVFAVIAVVTNIVLVLVSYRVVIADCGIAAVGLWSALASAISLIRIADVGLANACLRHVALCDVAQERQKARSYLETALVTGCVVHAVLALSGYLLVDAFLWHFLPADVTPQAPGLLPLVCLVFFLMNVSGIVLSGLQGVHRGYLNSQLTVAGSLVQLALVIALVPGQGLTGLALAQVAQYAFLLSVGWLALRHAAGIEALLPIRVSPRLLRDLVGFGVREQMTSTVNGLFEPLSKLLVGRFCGLEAQGLFELAFKSLWLPRNAVIGGVTAVVPALTALSRHDPDSAPPLYRSLAKTATSSVAGISLAGVVLSPVASWFWFGHFEARYSLFVLLLAFGVVMNARGAAAYNMALVTGNLAGNMLANAVSLMLLLAGGTAVGSFGAAPPLVLLVSVAMAVGGAIAKHWNEGDFMTLRPAIPLRAVPE
ncbi:oligosaccharide flippase family protein [Sinorhizobium sp. BG8]|uniref:lipopolysaccharide biosynthesis protein n=1 Tax=Sinorhizobium sp. BG8 TaxID=2613773 RepID=UPI00193D6DA5|nr:oligosaccharide flippase family protein [Sinorhizobium sp. BG8]QRM56455.1 oligosaccharide flippase family protein [Sinorhizobium sp. BG8]